jgi:hypothetical protein
MLDWRRLIRVSTLMQLLMALLLHPLLQQGRKAKNKGKALMLEGLAYMSHSIPGAPLASHLSLENIELIRIGYCKMWPGAMSNEALQAPSNEGIDN